VKALRGVPGVSKERFEKAAKIRHCALSLVGEPIMYPKINRLLELLHEKEISSFLVTNAQFPQQVRDLGPCTQLYTSIDAATKESLKKVDRPLNANFWELFLGSIDALREHKFNRSVFRLTLVQGYNMEEIEDYAKLVERGAPDFIEIKGVTYNGDDKRSKEKMTMKNVVFFFGCVFSNAVSRSISFTIDVALGRWFRGSHGYVISRNNWGFSEIEFLIARFGRDDRPRASAILSIVPKLGNCRLYFELHLPPPPGPLPPAGG